jgi:hypothetical protein
MALLRNSLFFRARARVRARARFFFDKPTKHPIFLIVASLVASSY